MTAAASSLVKTWAVGRYEVTLTVPPLLRGQVVHGSVEWSPSLPGELTSEEKEAYRCGLKQALASLAVTGTVTRPGLSRS